MPELEEGHDGQLTAQSEPGQGSTFILDIPASEEELEHIGEVFRAARATAAA